MQTVSIVIPTHVGRSPDLFHKAVSSAYVQTYVPSEICVAVDTQKQGAAATRQRALNMASSDWVSFLDSDDELYPSHVGDLLTFAIDGGYDYVWSYWDRKRTPDILGHFGKVFNPNDPHLSTITVLVRRELAQEAGFQNHPHSGDVWSGEDWTFQLNCLALGAKMAHLPKETWFWRHHGGNTSGVPTKGDARC